MKEKRNISKQLLIFWTKQNKRGRRTQWAKIQYLCSFYVTTKSMTCFLLSFYTTINQQLLKDSLTHVMYWSQIIKLIYTALLDFHRETLKWDNKMVTCTSLKNYFEQVQILRVCYLDYSIPRIVVTITWLTRCTINPDIWQKINK